MLNLKICAELDKVAVNWIWSQIKTLKAALRKPASRVQQVTTSPTAKVNGDELSTSVAHQTAFTRIP